MSASQVVSIVSDVELNFSYIGSNCTIESAFSAGFVARRCTALHGVAWLETHFPRESWPQETAHEDPEPPDQGWNRPGLPPDFRYF